MIERHLVPGQRKPISHYCHVVRADRHVWVSGSVGIRQDGTIPESTVEQFRVALDSVDAGIGDQVLIATDGFSAMTSVGRPQSPIDMAVVGFVDSIDLSGV